MHDSNEQLLAIRFEREHPAISQEYMDSPPNNGRSNWVDPQLLRRHG
jgi:hypothetical protein